MIKLGHDDTSYIKSGSNCRERDTGEETKLIWWTVAKPPRIKKIVRIFIFIPQPGRIVFVFLTSDIASTRKEGRHTRNEDRFINPEAMNRSRAKKKRQLENNFRPDRGAVCGEVFLCFYVFLECILFCTNKYATALCIQYLTTCLQNCNWK